MAQLIEQGMVTDFGTFISRKEYETIATEFTARPDTAYDTLNGMFEPGIIAIARAIMRTKAQ